MNIIEAIGDPRFFRPLFRDLGSWKSWFVFLKALFGIPLAGEDERQLLEQCTGSREVPGTPPREAYVIAGRRSGKSFISAVISVYLACFRDWRTHLNPGERGWIFIIATDREQAKIIKNYVAGILNCSPSFKHMVKKELEWEIELSNGVVIAVKTCNFRTVRGYTVLAAICEEVAYWRDDNSANPAKEILTAIRPSLATIPDGLLIGISTPYSRSGVLWEVYKTHYGHTEGSAPLVWKAPTRVMNPTIDVRIIDDALRDDYAAAKSEWLSDWREDIEAFLGVEIIEAAMVPGRFELPKIQDARYFAFMDPSGGRQDSFTCAICHREESGKIILDCIRETRPPFQPQNVVSDYSDVLKSYDISFVRSDRYGGEWVTSAFRDNEIMVENSELSSSEIYLEFLPLLMNGSVDLLDNRRLYDQLRGLERKTRTGGKDLVTHGPFAGAHDDVAVAVAGAVVLASKSEGGPDELLEAFRLVRSDEDMTFEEELEKRAVTWLLSGNLPPSRFDKQRPQESGEKRAEAVIKRWR